MKLQYKIINPLVGTKIPLPHYASSGAAGMDLRACLSEPKTLAPRQSDFLTTGLAIHIDDPNYAAIIVPRSGLSHRHGIILGNTIGLIDSDYQGELLISCFNRSTTPYEVQPGERVAQLVVIPVLQVQLEAVKDFVVSQRGESGFGSTGKH